MTYLGLCRLSNRVWRAAVLSWLVPVNRLCRKLGVNSGPFEMWICARTSWIHSDRLWLWLWDKGYIGAQSTAWLVR